MQEWKELEGQKSNLEEAHIQNFHWNGHSLNTAACWTPLTLATFGLARTLCQSTFPPIKVLPTFAEKQIGRVMLGTWAWPKARPLPHNIFQRLVICSLFYMFCVWLCAKTELRLIPQSKFLFATNNFQGQMVKLNQKGRRRAVLMLCVFNGLSKHTAKQLSSALQAQSSCPRWVLRSLSSPSHGFHLLLLPMSCGNVRPGGKKHEMTPLFNEDLPSWHDFSKPLFSGPPQFEAPATDPWWKRPLEEIQTFWNWIFSFCICINYDIPILYSFIFLFIACDLVMTF